MPNNITTQLELCANVFESYALTKKILHSDETWRRLDTVEKFTVLISHSDSLARIAATVNNERYAEVIR